MSDPVLSLILAAVSRIEARLDRIDKRLESIESAHEKIAGHVEDLRPEVTKIIDGLAKNPMLKMFLGGK